jgi:hypothetical protein
VSSAPGAVKSPKGEVCSPRQQQGFKSFFGDRKPIFFQNLEVTRDSFLKVGNGFFFCFPLADASRRAEILGFSRTYHSLSAFLGVSLPLIDKNAIFFEFINPNHDI